MCFAETLMPMRSKEVVMAQQNRLDQNRNPEEETFKRHGPEPPENDSGPSPSVEEQNRATNREGGASDSSAPGESSGRHQR
jgi:hypothetical protein